MPKKERKAPVPKETETPIPKEKETSAPKENEITSTQKPTIPHVSKLHVSRASRSMKAITPITPAIALSPTASIISRKEDDAKEGSFLSMLTKRSLGDSSSSDISYNESDFVLQRAISNRQVAFFDEIGEIPSINDIQLTSEEDGSSESLNKASMTKISSGPDVGKFVDPLTGEVLSSSSSSVLAIPTAENIEEGAEGEDDDFDFEMSDEALLEVPELEDQDMDMLPADDLELWNELQPKKTIQIDDFDFEEERRVEELRQITECVHMFLEEIIYESVEKAEYIDPVLMLRQNLDKKHLMTQLDDLVKQLEMERKTHIFVNRKVIEFYRRKKTLRPLAEEDPNRITANMDEYQMALNRLDMLIGQENEIIKATEVKTVNIQVEVEEMETKFQQSKKYLEDLIKKTLCKEHFQSLTLCVQNEMKGVSNLRDEISRVRLQLIQSQHDMARLLEESSKLDHIGEGLSLKTFMQLATQTYALSKKIEERNVDLNKIRMHFNSDLHARCHMREKRTMLYSEIIIREEVLEELTEIKRLYRQRVFDQKLERSRLKQQSRALSYTGGLIDKPWLMLDYDNTITRTEVMRGKVSNLKQKINEMQNRLELLEKQKHLRSATTLA